MLTWDSIQANAVAFSKRWKDGQNEEAETQAFLIGFLDGTNASLARRLSRAAHFRRKFTIGI